MTDEQQEKTYDFKDLKIEALKTRVAEEADRNADLRAELTLTIDAANKQIQTLVEENSELKAQLPEPSDEDDNEVPVEVPTDTATSK